MNQHHKFTVQDAQMTKQIPVATLKVTLDRRTGKKLSEEIVGPIRYMDEDEYWRPLVELLYGKMKEDGYIETE